MTEPTEAEVEAALPPIASAMFESYYSAIGNDKPNLLNEPASSIKLWKEDAYPIARAALTAAAQVRERAGVYLCRMPGGIHGGSCPTCGCEVIAADDPPTEPDSGPDVLGEKKGEGG